MLKKENFITLPGFLTKSFMAVAMAMDTQQKESTSKYILGDNTQTEKV